MAGLTVKLTGGPELERRLKQLNPEQNRKITTPALLESMLLTLRIAAREKIYPGGGKEPKANILTSRSGALRRSLAANFAIDRSGLPNYVEGGTHLIYGKIHEFGLGRYPKRPFLAPALADASSKFDDIFVKHWRKAGGL